MKKLSSLVCLITLFFAGGVKAGEPAKPKLTLSDLAPKPTYTPNNDPAKMQPPPPPPPQNYPTVKQDVKGDPRLYLNKDVSVGGTIQPPSANVQFPLPEGK